MIARVFFSLLLLALGAWARDHQTRGARPVVPETYHQTGDGTAAETADLARWWTQFRDPELNGLVARAVERNTDLRIAAARVTEARAMQGIQRSTLLPSIGSTNSFNRIRGGFAQGVARVGNASGEGASLVSPFETNSFQAGFDARWEIDFFGGNRKALRAAAADARAAEEARRDTLVTVIAEVARGYVELRGLDQRLEITRKNIEIQKETLDLTRARAEAGLGADLDVERQQAQLSATEAAEPLIESARVQTMQRIAVLLGEPPDALLAELQAAAALPAVPPMAAVGFPSDLLARRPDLRRAEAEVAAAAARVGVARSELFPKFVITGLSGRQSTDLGGFTLGAGNFFSVGPGIQLPFFTGGRIRANIAAQDARLDQAIARYEGAMLQALEDVENALVAYDREQQHRAKLVNAVESSRTATELANEVYSKGLADFLSVLDAQRAQYAAEDDLVQSDATVVTDLVALYKALGGGW